MTHALREYLLSVVASSLLLTVILATVPKGTIYKIAGIAGSLLVVLSVVSPLIKIDSASIAAAISKFSVETDELQRGIEIGNHRLLCEVISEKCETYILDKASSMGMTIEVEIMLEEDAEYPYPIGVALRGTWSAQEQKTLSAYISDGLGVPEQQQEWLLM